MELFFIEKAYISVLWVYILIIFHKYPIKALFGLFKERTLSTNIND
jgi:hypothetical protein